MSLSCRLLGLTNSADQRSVLQRYDLSSGDTVYTGLVNQYLRDVENGSTDIVKDGNPVISTLGSLFLDPHGVSKRVTTKDGPIDPLAISLLLEKELSKHTNASIMSPEKAQMTEDKLAQLKDQYQSLIARSQDSNIKDLSTQIEEESEKIKAHIWGLMKFGYFREFLVSSEDSINQNVEAVGRKYKSGLEKSLEGLVSSVLSLSIQHGITIPQPDMEQTKDFIGRIRWCRECIFKLVQGIRSGSPTGSNISNLDRSQFKGIDNTSHAPNEKKVTKLSKNGEQSTVELKTALKDLQFAHVYLTRQYEDERTRYNKSLNQLRLKLSQSQELLAASNDQLTNQTQQCLKLETKLSTALNELAEKGKQLHSKKLEISMLKVDHIGEDMSVPPVRNVDNGSNSNANDASSTLSNSTRSTLANGSGGANTVSAPILRMEFKKVVKQMNEDFEKELEKERVERKRLEKLVNFYEASNGSSSSMIMASPPASRKK